MLAPIAHDQARQAKKCIENCPICKLSDQMEKHYEACKACQREDYPCDEFQELMYREQILLEEFFVDDFTGQPEPPEI